MEFVLDGLAGMSNWRSSREMKRLLKAAFAALGYRVQGTRYIPRQFLESACLRTIELSDLISRRMLETGPELAFIQVGAFDGITADPLRKYIEKYSWQGVLVEPQARAVNKLRQLYNGNRRIVILHAALDRECGTRTLFTVESETAPAWGGGMASFQREHIVQHSSLISGIETMIREERVDCITFDEVLPLLASERIDLLQIDAEGSDAYLLSLFPFDRVRPAIVHWEIKHYTKAQKEECLDRLAGFGYRFAASGGEDMMAVLNWDQASVPPSTIVHSA
jgi:FkbM family methyltransferase